jgi:hypothetical protein
MRCVVVLCSLHGWLITTGIWEHDVWLFVLSSGAVAAFTGSLDPLHNLTGLTWLLLKSNSIGGMSVRLAVEIGGCVGVGIAVGDHDNTHPCYRVAASYRFLALCG